ncbi:hypothetical protein [Nonomuraea sp. SYSU D8015]|uniref:hypothetical protein n=1 Tax=Nonomuraea sp. SYSU D8015 TaxID=2593644 RepID=UPI001660E911|nr:hypothetical protein [Nonomuraea sp. SYSU D8015]
MITPKLEYLRHLAHDQIDQERSACLSRTGRLRGELAGAEERRQAAEREVRIARQAWEEARQPVPEEDLKERRLAESLRNGRPDSLVRARRLADRRRSLAAAEIEWAKAEERLAAAVQAVETLRQEIAREEADGRARARRVHEFVSRRAAAYLQQLVRTHPRGPDLNSRLELLGPDLPAWALEPPEFSGREPEAREHARDRTEGVTSDGAVAF